MTTSAILVAGMLTACTGSPGVDTGETPSAVPAAGATATGSAFQTGDDTTTSATASASPTQEGPLGDAQECENEELGYGVEYPGDWWANEFMPGDVPGLTEQEQAEWDIAACTYFAPGEVEIEEGTAIPRGVAVWFSLRSPQQPESEGEELHREQTTVDGHDALVVEFEPPAGGFSPEGTVIYQYIVDLGERHLVVRTDAFLHEDYEENREILDAMMETLEIED